MTTNQDHLKNLRNVLLSERERLGISVPATNIGAKDSTGPIDAGMSEALEQLVILAQLHAGRGEDSITRGYSEGNIALVRQYMKDRGVGQDQNDVFTGTVQTLDTLAGGQQKSVFDQQYSMGKTDFAIFKMQNEALLAGTSKTGAVPAARPLTAVFQQAGSGAPAPAAPATQPAAAAPAVAMLSGTRQLSYDDIQRIKEKGALMSTQDRAAVAAFEGVWAKYKTDKGYDAAYNAQQDALKVARNPYQGQQALWQKAADLRTENQGLLDRLKDTPLNIKLNGEDYPLSWNQIYKEVGWLEINDSAHETALRRAGLEALEKLKESSGYNARTREIASVDREAQMFHYNSSRNMTQTSQTERTLFADIRNDRLTINFEYADPSKSAQPGTMVAATRP